MATSARQYIKLFNSNSRPLWPPSKPLLQPQWLFSCMLALTTCQCKKQNQVCSGKSTGTQVESCKMCAGTCHLTAFCSHISPKWQFLHRHAGKSVPARKKLFRQCAGTRSPQQHPPPLTWLGCLVLGCPFGVCAGVLVAFFAPQPVKHVSIHGSKIDLLFALPWFDSPGRSHLECG